MKPRIRPLHQLPRRPVLWECAIPPRWTHDGIRTWWWFDKIGTGYTWREAYEDWKAQR